jgi:hypothetical protein
MTFDPSSIAALIVATSFAAGLNVYATVATLGILGRTHWVVLPPGLAALTDAWIIAVASVLFAVEVFADKIPGFDLVWNAAHTFIRVPVAALVAYKAASQLSPEMQLLATAGGALIAALAHTSKTAARALVTPSPEPVSNIALSGAEDAAAIGLTWFATHHPYGAATIACVALAAMLLALRWIVRRLKLLWSRRPQWLVTGAVLLLCVACAPLAAQTHSLTTDGAHRLVTHDMSQPPVPASVELYASFQARIMQADDTSGHDGELIFHFFAQAPGKAILEVQIPLASTGDAYGESRSCTLDHAGIAHVTLRAGLDEANYVSFAQAAEPHAYRFLLNKYLCRALAMPIPCGPATITLTAGMPWMLAERAGFQLSSEGAPAQAEVSAIRIEKTGAPFDYASCEQVAPSSGLCCVQHRTTAWHCGVKPEGDGWHQVSGDCYHRETGTSCEK